MRIAGLEFVEVVSVTRFEAGIADNVIPGEATVTVNLRYPPDRTPAQAEAHLRSSCLRWPSSRSSDPRPPAGGHGVSAGRVPPRSGRLDVEPKQAWTNVADFTTHGIDAVNYGPGHTNYAHTSDELVRVAALVEAYDVLAAFVGGRVREDTH